MARPVALSVPSVMRFRWFSLLDINNKYNPTDTIYVDNKIMFGLTLIREKILEYHKQTLTEILLLSMKINLDLKRFKNYFS